MIIVDLIRMAENWHQVLAAECGSPSVTPLRYFDPYFTSTLCDKFCWTRTWSVMKGEMGSQTVVPAMLPVTNSQSQPAQIVHLTVNQIVSVQPAQHLVD